MKWELWNIIPNSPNSMRNLKRLPQYIIDNDLIEIYPNAYSVILLTISVSTTSAETKLTDWKIFTKYYGKKRISSIETNIASKINNGSIMTELRETLSRKIFFLNFFMNEFLVNVQKKYMRKLKFCLPMKGFILKTSNSFSIIIRELRVTTHLS